jgi:hypothetical protein
MLASRPRGGICKPERDIAPQESDIIRHPIYTHVIIDTLKTNIVSQIGATMSHKCYIVFPIKYEYIETEKDYAILYVGTKIHNNNYCSSTAFYWCRNNGNTCLRKTWYTF